MTPCLALSLGDPAGVGPEVVCRLLAEGPPAARLLLVGDPAVLARSRAVVGGAPDVPEVPGPEALSEAQPVGLLAGAARLPALPPLGRVAAEAGRVSHAWVLAAAALARAGRVAGLVTGPIHKAAWAAAGVARTGHTEVLQADAGVGQVVMVLVGGPLWAGLATTHLPLRAVPDAIDSPGLVRALWLMHEGLRPYFEGRAPRLALCGLNPHAGDAGLYGDEEARVLSPAVAAARDRGVDVTGPLPADAAMPHAVQGRYDAVLAMYHDQALPAVKSLAPRRAVNLTLGLPYVRTSVDHGTAFDIAGTGRASCDSLREAIALAIRGSIPVRTAPT